MMEMEHTRKDKVAAQLDDTQLGNAQSSSAIRLRIAPSPTGLFHVGNARTALFNWLYARGRGGTFVLRIEDTDEERNREEWVDGILDTLQWLGLDWDEGPNRQSANKPLHLEAAHTLLQSGHAYYCDCTREQIDARNAANNSKPGYDNYCRNRNVAPGEQTVLRFRVPEGETLVHDLVRGDVRFDNATIEDFVIVRSNGTPMFVLANAIDDIHERISHVVRGEEHLPNTPKQQMMWSVLAPELPVPTYAHLPVIVNEKRQKLSKRRDKVDIDTYRSEGILPEAMCNYLALLGWSPKGDREIVSMQELLAEFDFVDVQKSSAFFDITKLLHFNGEYIRALTEEEFVARCQPFLRRANFAHYNAETFAAVAPLVQTRVAKLDEVAPMVAFFFSSEVRMSDDAAKVFAKEEARHILSDAVTEFATCEWTVEELHECVLRIGERYCWKLGKAQAPIRAAITGEKVGPPLFESLVLLGREEVLARMRAAVATTTAPTTPTASEQS